MGVVISHSHFAAKLKEKQTIERDQRKAIIRILNDIMDESFMQSSSPQNSKILKDLREEENR